MFLFSPVYAVHCANPARNVHAGSGRCCRISIPAASCTRIRPSFLSASDCVCVFFLFTVRQTPSEKDRRLRYGGCLMTVMTTLRSHNRQIVTPWVYSYSSWRAGECPFSAENMSVCLCSHPERPFAAFGDLNRSASHGVIPGFFLSSSGVR